MRRLMLALAVTAALVLSVAAPAAAAPEKNPMAGSFRVTCDNGETWTTTIGLPFAGEGWLLDGPPGTTPHRVLGGDYTLTFFDGTVLELTFAPPPGLADKWLVCRIEGPLEPIDHTTVIDPAYILKTAH
jgi:opacity protein-like surface antigen